MAAYLITFLGTNNASLQEACCWGMPVYAYSVHLKLLKMCNFFLALCNMLPQGKTVLLVQGFTDQMVGLLGSSHVNVRTSAVQCLLQFVAESSPP